MIEQNVSKVQIEREFLRNTNKFNYIACIVGVILNIGWFISDYVVIPEFWLEFLIFRLAVSSITLLCLFGRDKLKLKIHVCLFVLALGITIQNAYMWSVMDIIHFQKHSLAYVVLFIGIGMLVLWEEKYSWIILFTFLISNILFFITSSKLSIDEFLISGGLLTLTVAIFSVFMVRNRYRLTINEIKSRLEVVFAKKMVELKNDEITDSINYSKRIQHGLLNQGELLNENLKNHFVLFQPKDIVSGDFYWSTKISKMQAEDGKKIPTKLCDLFYVAICDSTGHGVPGAFMSLLNMSFLSEAVNEKEITKPHDVFNYVRERLIKMISSDGGKDGMDGILLCVNQTLNKVTYCAANNAPILIRNGELMDLPKDKMPVGKGEKTTSFTLQTIDVLENDVLYLYTDGYPDQFGGEKGKKFMYKKLNQLLLEIHNDPMAQQKERLESTFKNWKGNLEQVDDVLIMGIKF